MLEAKSKEEANLNSLLRPLKDLARGQEMLEDIK